MIRLKEILSEPKSSPIFMDGRMATKYKFSNGVTIIGYVDGIQWIDILDMRSSDSHKGNGLEALKWLRTQYKQIYVRNVLPSAVDFWKKMKIRNIIDGFELEPPS